MLTIKDIIKFAEENGAKVIKDSDECGIGFTDEDGKFHKITFTDIIIPQIPYNVYEAIKQISDYCKEQGNCEDCLYLDSDESECLFTFSPSDWTSSIDKDIKVALDTSNKHGYWITQGDNTYCSICGNKCGVQYDGVEPIPLKTPYCGCCNAIMDGGVDK